MNRRVVTTMNKKKTPETQLFRGTPGGGTLFVKTYGKAKPKGSRGKMVGQSRRQGSTKKALEKGKLIKKEREKIKRKKG